MFLSVFTHARARAYPCLRPCLPMPAPTLGDRAASLHEGLLILCKEDKSLFYVVQHIIGVPYEVDIID